MRKLEMISRKKNGLQKIPAGPSLAAGMRPGEELVGSLRKKEGEDPVGSPRASSRIFSSPQQHLPDSKMVSDPNSAEGSQRILQDVTEDIHPLYAMVPRLSHRR